MRLTPLEYSVMRAVWDSARPMSVKDIGVELGFPIEIATASVNKTALKLSALGMISRIETNKRRVVYAPTSEGIPIVTKVEQISGPKRPSIEAYAKRKLNS